MVVFAATAAKKDVILCIGNQDQPEKGNQRVI